MAYIYTIIYLKCHIEHLGALDKGFIYYVLYRYWNTNFELFLGLDVG